MLPKSLETAVYGVVSTHVLHLAEEHGVFTHLIAHGRSESGAMALSLGVDEETLDRMLLVLTAFGILSRSGDGRYALADGIAPFLDPSGEHNLGGFIRHMAVETPRRIGLLDSYLKSGKAEVDRALPSPFETIYRDEDATREFMAAMWDLSFGPSHEIASLAGLQGVTRLVDVGGAGGPFATAALLAAPLLRATVFDLPQVEPHLREFGRAHGVSDRLDFVAGDFFTDDLPEADCLAFGYVLSDWEDTVCAELLRKAHRACAPGGRVLVMERIFDDSRTGPLPTSVMNLTMHVETRGRHRTAGEYFALLADAGFTGVELHRTSGEKHLIVGHRR